MSSKTPGVYIDEENGFPNSVIAVGTSIPVFIGFTERAEFRGKSLRNTPTRIESLMEFETCYGKGCTTTYNLNIVSSPQEQDFELHGNSYVLEAATDTRFFLYDSLKFFYENGGGRCYIVSVGTYTDTNKPFASISPFINAIDLLKNETEPTMIVVPDAVLFNREECYRLQEHMLMHCGDEKNRVAILDIHDGYKGLDATDFNPIDTFRNNVSSDSFSYGAAYYPWLHTTIVQESEVSYKNLNEEGIQTLKTICKDFISTLRIEQQEALTVYVDLVSSSKESVNSDDPNISVEKIHETLSVLIPDYKYVMENILKIKNILPPSAAIAGVYTLVDSQRGVWIAPANVAISSVVSPTVLIDQNEQEDLNVPISGKAICAIRSFNGVGTMVWGARTLDANSLDWRYINVRRTLIMLEQSIKHAVKAYVFEPNNKNTWESIKAMIENFLTNLWKLGALAGSVPADSFSVSVGLGSTMTGDDIINGIINIEVKVAVSHPAEFMVITFQQQLQKA